MPKKKKKKQAKVSLGDPELLDRMDALLLECMALHQRMGEVRHEMGPALKEGWIQISEAQFMVGRAGVSSDSYNLGAPAVTTLRTAAGAAADSETVDGTGANADSRFWGLQTALFDAEEQAAPPASDTGDGVRQRRSEGAPAGPAAAADARAADPLRWFGGAKPPPAQLRSAQSHFQLALRQAIQLANMQTAFRIAADEYEMLASEKRRRKL